MGRRYGRGQMGLGVGAVALVLIAGGCTDDEGGSGSGERGSGGDGPSAVLAGPDACITVRGAEAPENLAVAASIALFESAPAVIVAPALDGPDLRDAATEARERGVPLLLHAGIAPATGSDDAGPEDDPTESPDPAATDPPATAGPEPTETAEPGTAEPGTAEPGTADEVTLAAEDTADCAEPTAETTPAPTDNPTNEPTTGPTDEPTTGPTDEPTAGPTDEPTDEPTNEPTDEATDESTAETTDELDSAAAAPGEPTEDADVTPTEDAETEPSAGEQAARESEPGCLPDVNTAGSSAEEPSAGTPRASMTPTPIAAPSADDAGTTAEPTEPVAETSGTETAAAARSPEAETPAAETPAAEMPTRSSGDAVLDPAVAEEISRLDPEAVLAITPEVADAVRAALPDLEVVTEAGDLPETSLPAEPLAELTVLAGYSGTATGNNDPAGAVAAAATGAAAGARVLGVTDGDPRADSCAIEALAADPPEQVLGIGGFGPAEQLAERVAVAVTGVQLPGGGQRFFPGRRLVAMYGYPGAPELGVLGAQGPEASVDRAQALAEQYEELSDVPVVPTFEIITTVAQGVPGADGDYSAESSIDAIRPLVEAAHEAGMYAILDLQPGRTDFLTQAKRYEELLKLPYVGLALDPEWRLKPGQVHLQQIGSVDASEVNQVSAWLADLTARYRLPQKVLVVHQFTLTNRASLDTSHDEVALLIHFDGQGEPSGKEGSWRIITNTMPEEIWLGWKNFYRKDTRLMTPTETLDREPVPVMISYQ